MELNYLEAMEQGKCRICHAPIEFPFHCAECGKGPFCESCRQTHEQIHMDNLVILVGGMLT